MLIISRSVMMGCVIGAMAYVIALAEVPFVRRADQTCGPYMLANLTFPRRRLVVLVLPVHCLYQK